MCVLYSLWNHTLAIISFIIMAFRWIKEYGCLTIRFYHFWGKERVLTADPKVFRHILVTNEKNYVRVLPKRYLCLIHIIAKVILA